MPNKPHLLDDVLDVLATVLFSSCVTDAVPVSAVLVADSGTAKSKIIKQYFGEGVHHTDSFSSQGLFHLMQTDPESKIRYILTPDLNPTLSRQAKTVTSTVANLLTLTMDGTCRIDDGRQEKIVKHKPIGILTAVTPEMYRMQTKKWFALGLTRRIIPIFYTYSDSTIRSLLDIVQRGQITGNDFPVVPVDISAQHKPAISEQNGRVIEGLALQFGTYLGMSRGKDREGKLNWYVKKIIPISPVVILRTLAQAHAIRGGTGEVGAEQLNFVVKFLSFCNPSEPRQI